MAKKNDFSDITKKLNITGLVDNVKSLISPTGATPDPEEGDQIGHQLAELSLLIQEMQAVNAEQGKRMNEINKLFNAMFETLKAEREGLEEAVEQANSDEVDDDDGEPDDADDADEKKPAKKTTKKKD